MKPLYWLLLFLFLVLATGFFIEKKFGNRFSLAQTIPTQTYQPLTLDKSKLAEESIKPEKTALPASFMITDFPFQSQAPFGNWDELHDEACEEASIILANAYLKDVDITTEDMEKEIQQLVGWQMKNFGKHANLTVQETSEVAEENYDLETIIKTGITAEDIKKEIVQNHPVILPTAGRLLGNPYFRGPGPLYHMVVAIGYDKNNFIVQDVGTKRGNYYRYSQPVLMNAIHDWPGDQADISTGAKSMLVVFD